MSETRPVRTLRLLLWPSLITLAINVLRCYLEVHGSIQAVTGGALAPLGITWLAFVFGAWFGWRLRRAGSRPRRRAFTASLLALLLLVAVVAFSFSGLDRQDTSPSAFAQLRSTVQALCGVAAALAVVGMVLWWRLGLVLLMYAIPARLTVLLLTYLAKTNGWDTHYVKFGPAGIERDLGDTMLSAAIAQLGFWVPFTMVAGSMAGNLAALLVRPRATAAAAADVRA